jgi:succinate-semialdehyde dehydrogenase/glutarate-semialdehyde dehydrogenase
MADYAVVDPASGTLLKEYPTISDGELDVAIARAAAAHRSWSRERTVAERAAAIRRVGELHEERKQELGEILSREMGKPIQSAIGEAAFTASIYRYYADNADELLADEPIALLGGQGSAFVRRSSIGVLLGIMPWNYPYYQAARFAAPNLVIGNTILLKPAPQCPESAEVVEQIFGEAGIPGDVFINIYATNDQASAIIADPLVQGVSLTGSSAAGSAVASLAGRHLKKVVLELGGSDPFLVLSTDDMDSVVGAAVGSRMANAGQACNAAKRFIVIDELYDQFLDKFTTAITALEPGDPKSADTAFGPLSSAGAAQRLEAQVQLATEQGATLVAGGERDGNYFKATVLADIAPDNAAAREEFFGPVAQIYKVASEDEAVEIANDTEFGLGSYVFTTDREQALRVADKIEAGMVFINITDAEGPELPFGGVKKSGFGRELGRYGADEFVNKKLFRVGG